MGPPAFVYFGCLIVKAEHSIGNIREAVSLFCIHFLWGHHNVSVLNDGCSLATNDWK